MDTLKQYEDTTGKVTPTTQDDLYSTRSWQEIDKTREQALTDYMAGVTDQLTPATTQPTIVKTPIDQSLNPYDAQVEVLSKLNLIDENLNPTQTYTDYINAGGTPVPGYESEHNQLLKLDQIDEYQKAVDKGAMTEDQMLWDLYALDILETEGYKFRSVGWWQSKFQNNDFTNPAENDYLRHQVLQTAKAYHNSLIAKKYASTQKMEDSKLAALAKGQDLSVKDVRELFPELSKYTKYENDDEAFMRDLQSGRIGTELRIYTTESGRQYYLHTDGELYELTNEGGEHTARYKKDSEGHFTEISINGNDIIDYASNFLSGFGSVFTGLVKLGGMVPALITGGTEGLTDWIASVDAWTNDNLGWFAQDSGRIDLDGFNITDVNDWLNTLAYTGGMVMGGRAVGKIASAGYNWGTKLANSEYGIVRGTGQTAKAISNLWARSTGMYQGFGPDIKGSFSLFGNVIYTGKNAMFLNHAFKTVPTYMMKDYYQTLTQLQNQRMSIILQQVKNGEEPVDPTTDSDIALHAFSVTAINGAISTVFAGGIDDNQAERLKNLFAPKVEDPTKRVNIAYSLFKHLSSERCYVASSTVMDFLDNFFTMAMSDFVKVDSTGTHWTADSITLDNIVKTGVTAAIMTHPTYKSAQARRNIGFESLMGVYQESLDTIDANIRKTSNPEEISKLKAARDLLVNDFKQATTKDGETDLTTEERALYALNKLHQATEDDQGKSIVTERLYRLTDEKVLTLYKQMSDEAHSYYKYMQEQVEKNVKDIQNNGAKQSFLTRFKNLLLRQIPTKSNLYTKAAARITDSIGRETKLNLDIQETVNKYYNVYLDLTDSKTAQEFEDKYKEYSTLKNTFDETTEVLLDIDEETKPKVETAVKYLASLIDIPEGKEEETENQIRSNMIFYKFKNEAGGESRKDMVIRRATASNLSKLLPYNFVRIDDDIYAFTGLGTETQQLFTQDVFVKTTLAAELITNEHYKEGAELYLSTALGDTTFDKALKDKNATAIKTSKEMLYSFLQNMIDSNALTKLQASRFIEELAKGDSDLSKALNSALTSKTNINHKNVTDANQLNPIESYTLRYNAFKILRDNNSKMGNSSVIESQRLLMDQYGNVDKFTKEVFDDMVKNGELSKEFFDDYNKLVTAISKQHESFQTTSNIERLLTDIAGNGQSTFDDNKIDTAVSSILGSDAPEEIVKALKEKIIKTADLIKEFKSYDKEMNENIIVLNATLFTNLGKTKLDNELLQSTTEEANNRIERWTFTNNGETVGDITNYLELSDKLTKTGTPYYVIDLDNPDDIKFFNDLNNILHFTDSRLDTKDDIISTLKGDFIEEFAKSFILYNYGKELAADIITEEEAKQLNAYLYKERLYKKNTKDKVTVFYNDGSVSDIDLYTFIANSIGPTYISQAMKNREYILANKDGKATLGLNPFNLNKTLKYNADLFQGTSLDEAIKTGRIGGEAAKKLKMLYSQGDYATVNKQLSTELMLLKYADELTSSNEKTIYLDPSTYKKAVKAGIVDAEDSFYKTNDTFDRGIKNPKYIPITLTASKEDLEYYILHEKNFNLFKMLPLASKEPLDTGSKFIYHTDADIPNVTGGINTVPRLPIYNIFNDTFEWDNGNKLRTELINGLLNADGLKYNPLESRTQVLDIPNVEEYVKYRKSGKITNDTDIYSKLILLYEAQDAMYVGKDTNEDFKLWLADDNTLKEIIDSSETLRNLKLTDAEAYEQEKIKLANKIISDYESRMSNNITPYTEYTSDGITYNSYYGTAGRIPTDDNTVISKRTLDALRGIGYNFIETDSQGNKHVYDSAAYDIGKAIDFVVDYDKAFLDDAFISTSAASKNYTVYQPNDAIKLRTFLSADDSQILIKDLDEYYRIEFEAYKQLFEAAMGKEGIQVAQRVKNRIDELYKKFIQLDKQNVSKNLVLDKSKVIRKSRTQGAATSQTGEGIVNRNGLTGNQQIRDYILDNYVKEKESVPKADLGRLYDLMSDDVDTYEQLMYGNKERYAQMYTNNPGQLEINNISRGMNAYKVANTIVQTSEELDKIFEANNITGVDTMALADQLHLQSDGTRYMTEWAKYNLFDPKTGKSELGSIGKNVYGSAKDRTDVLVLLDKPDEQLIGKVFFDLDKHSGRDQGSISFKYTIINDANDINDLRTAAILDVFEDNKYNSEFKGGYSIDSLRNLSPDKLLGILNTAVNNSVLRKNINQRIINNLSESNIAEENIYKILQDPEEYKTKYLANNIKQIQGGKLIPALQSDNPIVREQASAIIYALHYDLMNEDLQKIVRDVRDMDEKNFINKYWAVRSYTPTINYNDAPESLKLYYTEEEFNNIIFTDPKKLSNFYDEETINKLIVNNVPNSIDSEKLNNDIDNIKALAKALDIYSEDSEDTINRVKEYFKDDPQGLEKMIEGYFVYGNTDSGVLHYRINKDENLVNMYDKRHSDKPKSSPIRLSYTTIKQDQDELRNFFNESTQSTLKQITGVDFETTNVDRDPSSIKDVFQIGLIKYVKDEDGKLIPTIETKYVEHDGYASTKDWAENPENIDTKSKFFINNKTYQDALEKYKSLQHGDPDLISEEEAIKLLANNDMLIAYNGESFDFNLIKDDIAKLNKKMKYLDATELIKREQLDVSESASLENKYFNNKRKFSTDFLGKVHDAEEDTKMMMELFIEKLNSNFDLAKDRTSLVGKFEKLVDLSTPEGEHRFKQLLSKIDTDIRELKSEAKFDNNFKEDSRTIDDITYTARLFNHGLNTARGELYSNLIKELSDNSVKVKLIENNTYPEINKVLAFVASTQGKEGIPDFGKALTMLKNASREIAEEDKELPGSSHTLSVIANPDKRLMDKLGLSINSYENKESNDDYNQAYGILMNTLHKGKKALLDQNNIFNIEPKAYQDYLDRGYLDNLAFSLQSMMADSKDVFKNNPDLKELWNNIMVQPLTAREDFNVKDILDYVNDNIYYKDKKLDSILAQLENQIDNDTIASIRTQSGYKMFNSFDPNPIQTYMELDVINNRTKRLDNIKAGDIVITKALLDKMVGYKGYDELLGDDGNLYLYTISYPSDNPNSLMAHRIRVINDMGDGNTSVMRFGFTPETQAILRARDFDGDYVAFFKPQSKSSIEIASAVNKYLYNEFNVEEKIASYLRGIVSKEQPKTRFEAEALRLSTDSDIKNICLSMDEALSKNDLESITKYTEDLKNTIRTKTDIDGKTYDDDYVNKIAEYLGVVEKFKGEVKFVNNPAIWTDIEGENGNYSYKQRVEYYKLRAFNTSNILDSVTGYNQKLWSKSRIDINDVKAPLIELYSPTIYLTDTLSENIDTKLTTQKDIEDYYDTIYKSIKTTIDDLDVSSKKWKNSVLTTFKEGLNKYEDEALSKFNVKDKETNDFIKNSTLDTLHQLGLTIKTNVELNNKVLDLLKNDTDNSYLEQLNRNKETMKLIKELKNEAPRIRTVPKLNRTMEDIYLRGMINNQSQLAKANEVTDIPDLLGEVKKLKNKNTDINKYYIKNSSRVIDDKMRTSYGLVFIADDNPKLLVDEDTIAVTNSSSMRAARIETYENDMDHIYELSDDIIKEFNTKKDVLLEPDTIIGYKKVKGSNHQEGISINRPMHLINISYNLNGRISGLLLYQNETLNDKKLKIDNMAKGKAKVINIDSFEVSDDNNLNIGKVKIDFIINMNNAVKNTDKYGLLPNIGKAFSHLTRASITVNGEIIHGYLVPRTDAFVIGDDSKYSKHMNTELDNKAGNKLELMFLGGQATTLTGIGGITGNSVIFLNNDGTINISNRNISDMFEGQDSINNLMYKNVADAVLTTRAQLLCDELGDDAMAKVSEGLFKTTKEYIDNIMSSPSKINSRRLAMELLIIQKVLGGEKVNKIKNKNAIAKAVFDPYFDEYVFYPATPTKMATSEDVSQDRISSGNAQVIMAQQGAEATFGKIYNDAETGLVNNKMAQEEAYYIPWNWLYKNISGYEPNSKHILKGTADGYFSIGKHLKDGSTFENRWMPVNVNRAYKNSSISSDSSISNGTKSIEEGATDKKINYGMPSKMSLGEGNYNILNDYNNPLNPTIKSLVGKALNNEQVYGDYAGSRQTLSILDYLINVNDSKNRNKLSKLASIKGIKGVDYDLFNYGYRTIDNELIRSGDITSGTAKINDAVKDINHSAKTFWTYKDIIDQAKKANITEDTINTMLNSKVIEEASKIEKSKKDFYKEKNELTKNLFNTLRKQDLNQEISTRQKKMHMTINYRPTTEAFEPSWMSRSGIKVKGPETGLIDMAIKNTVAYSEYYKQDLQNQLNELKGLVSSVSMKDFTDYAIYNMLKSAESTDTPEMFNTRLKYCGLTKDEYNSKEFYNKYKTFMDLNPTIVSTYKNFINNMIDYYEKAATAINEPFGPTYIFFSPYVPKDKKDLKATIANTFHNISTLTKFDPIKAGDMINQNLMLDFFNGSEKIIREVGQLAGIEQMSKILLGDYIDTNGEQGKAMIDNVEILDKVFEILNAPDLITNVYASKEDMDVTPDILNIISLYTDLDYYTMSKNLKNNGEILKAAYKQIASQVEKARNDYAYTLGEVDSNGELILKSFSEIYSDANNASLNQDVRAQAQDVYNKMWAQSIIVQRIMEVDSHALKKVVDFIDELPSKGKVLVNKQGQIISRDTYIKPLMSSSLKYLKDNVELSLNNMNKEIFAQFVMEKALNGEIYLADESLARQLENNLYTTKIGGKVKQTFQKISKVSAGIQMSLPAKMLGRLMRFTGFDYALDAIANPRSIPYMAQAAKEISQAVQTNGKVMTDELIEYLKREGQPSIGQGSKKDPINFTEEMAITDFTNKLTKPLENQNHLGRYAIYLTAKHSFDEGNPWYGPLYGKKEAVDALPTNEDKAMYIMDYMLGSPGGFPNITKKMSGYMMYSTFPMNLTRTMGAYGESLSRLFKEGFTSENKKYWFDTAVIPSAMAVGICYLGAALIAAVCDMFGIDEETEKKWKEEGVWIDPLGTMLGGTPSVVYDSINPVYNIKEMYINPFTNEYNDTLPKKAYGWVQSNFLSKLNPAIKTPIEIATRRELYGDNADNTTKYQYTNMENGMRKVLGFFIGSGVANAVIDERKMNTYNKENNSFAGDLWKGITKGVSADLGNQKSWKQNTSNYYSVLSNIRQYKNAATSKDSSYAYTKEDLTDADSLYYSRHYSTMYGKFDESDYKRINNLMRKMIKDNQPASAVYALIVDEFNKGVSEATLRSVLNSNSIIRKLNSSGMNKNAYLNSLNDKEKIKVKQAIEYEEYMYPLLSKFFPDEESTKKAYIPNYQKVYNGSGSGSPSSSKPYTPTNRYYPGRYYPSTYKFNKKTGRYGPNLERVKVNVSPQMAIWNQDKNLTPYDTGLDKTNNPKWLRSKGYTSLVNNI